MAAVGDACEGIPVAWSPEDPILGTAGAIRRAAERGLLGDEPFLVVNGDLFTTLPFAPLRAAFDAPGVVSALGVLPHAVPGETALWGDAAGRLVSLGNERRFPTRPARGSSPASSSPRPRSSTGFRPASPSSRATSSVPRRRNGTALSRSSRTASPKTVSGSTSARRRSSRRPRRRSPPRASR